MKNKSMFSGIKGKILFSEPLYKHTTFRIGGPCDIWAEPRDEKELSKILKLARLKKKRVTIIGRGSNVLPRDKGLGGVVIHLGGGYFKKARKSGLSIKAGAGIALSNLINFACKNGFRGIEGLVGIPGTLGGAIFMNAGYKGNISDVTESVKVMDKKTGRTLILKKKDLKFSYRHSNLNGYIILEATLRLRKGDKKALLRRKNELLRIKRHKQPLGSFSAGCIFKNPRGGFPAARYIEMLRLKGKKIGDAKISEKHANFIVNLGNAKSEDVLRLIDIIRKRVKKRFGIELAPEINRL